MMVSTPNNADSLLKFIIPENRPANIAKTTLNQKSLFAAVNISG
ncbi:MAG: hypothetical protein N3F64_00320 [Nitrososphaeria archaeon]|nr:hypothetical protein [Nitrososphaeria archaeon]